MLEEWTLGRGLGSQQAQGSPPSNLGKTQGLWSPVFSPTIVLLLQAVSKRVLGPLEFPATASN